MLKIEFSVKIGKHSLTSTNSKMDFNVRPNFQKRWIDIQKHQSEHSTEKNTDIFFKKKLEEKTKSVTVCDAQTNFKTEAG